MRLAGALAKSADVYCVSLKPTTAAPEGVTLRHVSVDGLSSTDAGDLIRSTLKISPDWWVGHDVHTGNIALACRRGLELTCVLNHMDYLSYKPYERDPETIKKMAAQATIFQDADVVVAVGPKLFRTLRDLAPSTRRAQLVPGCDD